MTSQLIRKTALLAILATATACAPELSVAPQRAQSAASTSLTVPQVPLLYVVDGVRLQRDQLPALSQAQIASVQVLKGHAALKEYGPDASYGVVIIKTKLTAPRS